MLSRDGNGGRDEARRCLAAPTEKLVHNYSNGKVVARDDGTSRTGGMPEPPASESAATDNSNLNSSRPP